MKTTRTTSRNLLTYAKLNVDLSYYGKGKYSTAKLSHNKLYKVTNETGKMGWKGKNGVEVLNDRGAYVIYDSDIFHLFDKQELRDLKIKEVLSSDSQKGCEINP